MFIKSNRCWYGRDGEQKASGAFLMIFSDGARPRPNLRALVRHVRMHQCGHWMMATLIIKSDAAKAENDTIPAFDKAQYPNYYNVADGHYSLSLSGTYGEDGLPKDVSAFPGLWEQLHPVPEELREKFWNGGGHNCAGSEAMSMHEWANENINTLRKLVKS